MLSAITVVYFNHANDVPAWQLKKLYTQVLQSHNITEVLVVDNSPQCFESLKTLCANVGCKYIWNQGYNVYYVGGIRIALKVATNEHCVYFSSTKVKINNLAWTDEILQQLFNGSVLVGSIEPCNTSIVTPNKVKDLHVQGGLFGLNKSFYLKATEFCKNPQAYSDVWVSHFAYINKQKVTPTRTVCSVNDKVLTDPEKYYAVHHGTATIGDEE